MAATSVTEQISTTRIIGLKVKSMPFEPQEQPKSTSCIVEQMSPCNRRMIVRAIHCMLNGASKAGLHVFITPVSMCMARAVEQNLCVCLGYFERP